MRAVSWCVVVACVVGVVVGAPSGGVVEKTVTFESHPQPHHQQGFPTHSHHNVHTIDPAFRQSQFYQAMDEAGANLFKGLGRAATSLGDFLSRLAGGNGQH